MKIIIYLFAIWGLVSFLFFLLMYLVTNFNQTDKRVINTVSQIRKLIYEDVSLGLFSNTVYILQQVRDYNTETTIFNKDGPMTEEDVINPEALDDKE